MNDLIERLRRRSNNSWLPREETDFHKAAEAIEQLGAAVEAVVGAGGLNCGAAGLSDAQKKLYAAWLVMHPDRAGRDVPSHCQETRKP